MSLPLTDDLGVVQTTTSGTPVYWNNGLGYDVDGNLCVTTEVLTTDVFIGGKRRSALGRLVVADATPAGRPFFYNAGWPSDKNTGATIRQTGVPADTDPRVAGIAIGPLGGVYMTNAGFSPADLFANGEPGFWYDPSDLSTMFQDSAGTIPMQPVGTVADQPVGLILDKSGNNHHASQATSTARPVLSARVNLLTKTEDFANAAWFNSASLGALTTAPDGTTTAQIVSVSAQFQDVKQPNYATLAGQVRTVSVWMKWISGNTSIVLADDPGGAHNVAVTISSTWTRFSYTAPAIVSNGDGSGIRIQDRNASGWGSFAIWHPQAELGSTATSYQRVNTNADYNAAGFPTYLKFDGVDDSLATASFAMNGTSKATVFSGYANGKTATTGTQLEFSANYMNNNGSMALLVPSLSTSNVSFGSRGTLGAGEKDSPTAPAGGLEKRVLTAYQDYATTLDYGCDFIRAQGIPLQNLIGVGNTDVGAGPFGTYPAYIGARAGTANFMNGQIYSLILAGNGYDAQTLENMENYVDSKLHP